MSSAALFMVVSFVADNGQLGDSHTRTTKICFKQYRNAKLSSGSGWLDDSRSLSRPYELRQVRLVGAWRLPGSTSRDEAPRAVLIQHEFWDGPNHIRIAHQREAAIVQDQPLPVHARCQGRMVFLLKDVSQDDDPHIFMG